MHGIIRLVLIQLFKIVAWSSVVQLACRLFMDWVVKQLSEVRDPQTRGTCTSRLVKRNICKGRGAKVREP